MSPIPAERGMVGPEGLPTLLETEIRLRSEALVRGQAIPFLWILSLRPLRYLPRHPHLPRAWLLPRRPPRRMLTAPAR